jgi:hypothetical protein
MLAAPRHSNMLSRYVHQDTCKLSPFQQRSVVERHYTPVRVTSNACCTQSTCRKYVCSEQLYNSSSEGCTCVQCSHSSPADEPDSMFALQGVVSVRQHIRVRFTPAVAASSLRASNSATRVYSTLAGAHVARRDSRCLAIARTRVPQLHKQLRRKALPRIRRQHAQRNNRRRPYTRLSIPHEQMQQAEQHAYVLRATAPAQLQ